MRCAHCSPTSRPLELFGALEDGPDNLGVGSVLLAYEVDRAQRVSQGAADAPTGGVGDRQDAIAGALDQPPACRSTNRSAPLIMAVEQLLPPPVAGGSFGGPDDVGEQHRGQQPLGPLATSSSRVSTTTSRTPREKSMSWRSAAWSKSDVFQEASPSTALENWSSKVTLLHPGSRTLWPRCE